MSEEVTSYEVSEGVATITMDDGKANALSMKMSGELAAGLDRAESEAKAVLIVGRTGKFSAGFDLGQMMAGPVPAAQLVKAGGALLMRLYELPLPVVIACTGHALAAGALLAGVGDTRIGALGPFKIGLNETQNGMPLPGFGIEIARDRLVPAELTASVVQAKLYDPEGAVRAGWLDRVVPVDHVKTEAMSEAIRLGKLPNKAHAATKRALRKATVERVHATLGANVDELVQMLVT